MRRHPRLTYKEMEKQVATDICEPLRNLGLLREGYRCSVQLRGKKNRKPRTASFNEKNWSPDTDSVCISFRPLSEEAEFKSEPVKQGAAVSTPQKSPLQTSNNPLPDLVRALGLAESRPGYKFVALKWFRDVAIPSSGFAWANEESIRQILGDAIDRRLILISKVPNPKSPQFPVTAIRLNRLMPEVAAILGIQETIVRDFRPVPIRGENLSATVLSDRR
jgi:hypothetical protein